MAAPRSGETIYKGHRSYDLMRNLQIGILFSIAKTNREISEREVNPRPEDYKQQVRVNRPLRAVVHTSKRCTSRCNSIPRAGASLAVQLLTPDSVSQQVTQQFPRSGQSTSFKWKDYSPLIFHRLREAFGIDNRDYLLSLTGDKCALLLGPGEQSSLRAVC